MNNELGQYIYELRIKEGYSQAKLADLESGKKSNPSISVMAKLFDALNMNKDEIEKFLDIHAKLNGCVSYDIADFIMKNDDIRKAIRSERDNSKKSPDWQDFIEKMRKMLH